MVIQFEISEFVAKRLSTLAEAKQTAVETLAAQALDEFTSSRLARRSIRAQRKGASLSDLGWIDGYNGQTVDDILAFGDSEDPIRVLVPLCEAIEQHWRDHPGKRTGVENIILASTELMQEVNNGGFDQFFRNSSKRWAFFVADALLHVGRTDAATIARRAVTALGVPKSARAIMAGVGEKFTILDQNMSQANPERDEILNECNIEFYALTGLPASILNYARSNSTGILRD